MVFLEGLSRPHAHRRAAVRIRLHAADRRDELWTCPDRYGFAAIGAAYGPRDVTVTVTYEDHRSTGRKNAVELARHDEAFEFGP